MATGAIVTKIQFLRPLAGKSVDERQGRTADTNRIFPHYKNSRWQEW